ncbi:MAG: hypothetical protein JXB49_30030 [Bacteroidales bacterium]|nr:hypothetical protein [Bacteroidales bacterium]
MRVIILQLKEVFEMSYQGLKRKNDYTCIVFLEGKKRTLKYVYVHSLRKFASMLDRRFPSWMYMNVYVRRTGLYLVRYYKNDSYIPDFYYGYGV